ncbi:phospholipase A2 [Streptomyces sp. NPDC058739]|uniref:phospholipase A2 n=1 Tax=Streptomyces sp. NPDC058739 TaxID=3346618 RepID=UPI003684B7C4
MKQIASTHDHQQPGRAVGVWHRFHGALRMLCLLAVGVLALGVAANADDAGRPASVYDSTAPVELEDIVATGKGVYGLSADHRGVYEWTDRQAGWKQILGDTAKLYAGGDNLYATDPATGSIWKYDGDEWNRIGGPGRTFAAADDKLYGISPDGGGVWEYTGKGDVWKQIGGPAKDLYTGPAWKNVFGIPERSVVYATNPVTGELAEYNSKKRRWTKAGDAGATFAVTDENLYGLTPDGSAVVERDPDNGQWKPVGERAEHIFSSNTLYMVARDSRDLYKYNGKPGQWHRLSGPATAFATSGDYLYRLAADRRSVQKYNGNGTTDEWLDLHAPAVPVTREEKLARLSSIVQLGPDATAAYNEALDAHRAGKPDPHEFRWKNDKCSAPAPNSVLGYDFTPACVRHDFGYRNYRDLHGEHSFNNDADGRALIDKILLQDLNATCVPGGPHGYNLDIPACKVAARTYFAGVRVRAFTDSLPQKFFGWRTPGIFPW